MHRIDHFKGKRAFRAMALAVTGIAGLALLPASMTTGALAAASDFVERPLSIVATDSSLGAFTPSSADPNLLKKLQNIRASRNSGLYRFTPSGSTQRGERDVTVAVRVNSDTARAVSVRNAVQAASATPRIDSLVAPVKFNLGIARDYQSFARTENDSVLPTRALDLSDQVRDLNAPDLSTFTPSKSDKKSRFSPQLAFEGETVPGRAPRTLRGEGDVSVDVGGAYRVARNLKVTAGIRYSSDRDNPEPMVDGSQDSQSVYVGTRFRF